MGDPAKWPESLKAAVRICVGSRNPIVIWWGKKALTQIYNDGYMRILTAAKHPHWLGRSGAECWSEIMETMGPLWDQVLATGEATWFEDFLYVMNRNLPREECYFTFSYSALRNDAGIVDGILCICYETTSRVLGDGRLRTLRDLGRTVAMARTPEAACKTAAEILGANPGDIPFSLMYLLDDNASQAYLVAASGFAEEREAVPGNIDLTSPAAGWPLKRVFESGTAELVSDLSARFGPLPGGLWPEPTETALVVPITSAGQPRGFLVVGCSTRRILDADYRSFFDLVAGHISTAIANASAYEEERKRAEALAELDRAKTAFFSNVSHEFRTPLTLILGPLEDALAETTELPQRERLDLIHRNALRLQKLVNTLLDFSRIEAGRIQASYEATDLAELTAELASVFRSAVEKAGMQLIVHCAPIAEPVFVDRDMYEKIVLNLLSNALKFTLEGRIEVMLRDAGAAVELSVIDTGAGISEEHLPHIFERFHRIEGVRSRTHEGTGIGLALVQELVKLHGGSIHVRSVGGQGSAFTVAIPKGRAHLPSERIDATRQPVSTALAAGHYVEEALRWLPEAAVVPADDDSTRAPDSRRPKAGINSRARILWADDNADMRDYIGRLLGKFYEVEAVSDGEAALAAVNRRLPDLVLADVMMPRLDGFGLLKALRADERTRSIPVILLSARAGEESRVEGMQAGADDYLIKPFSARELVARVDSHLNMALLRSEGEHALRESVQRQALLASELRHRVRNLIAVIRTISSRTARTSESMDEYAELMDGRLMSLARTQDLLTRDGSSGLDVADVVRDEISAHALAANYEIDGPRIVISAKAAEVLGLAVHELATNSLKYGALSGADGRVSVSWQITPRDGESRLSFDWSERSAQELQNAAPFRRGFGTELIERRIPYELDGVGRLKIDGSGAHCHIEFPLRPGASILESDVPAN